jgi:uncharacterized protein
MWAASRGYNEAVQMLIKAGADVNLKNQGGYTAQFNGYEDVVQSLRAVSAEE